MVTIHDIEANGKTYILEWVHNDDKPDLISITETFDGETEDVDFEHEIYDFEEVV